MTFVEFLLQKRIKSSTFQASKPELWAHFAELFAQMGEKSFDAQKKFYFNPLRADFPFSVEEIEQIEADKKAELAAKKAVSIPIMPVKEVISEETPKKMPPKMKPIIKKEPVLEEKIAETNSTENEPIKKAPPKMKPIMKKETKDKES